MVFLREKEGVAEQGNQQPEKLPQHTAGIRGWKGYFQAQTRGIVSYGLTRKER